MEYERLWPCAVCGGPVVYDSREKEIACACGVVSADLPLECVRWNYKKKEVEA